MLKAAVTDSGLRGAITAPRALPLYQIFEFMPVFARRNAAMPSAAPRLVQRKQAGYNCFF
jgi:hypothetical protein